MNQKKAIQWLKAAFMVGAITDALALLPMLFNSVARIFWGFETFSGTYVFAMRLAAVFMLVWTILLLWAWKKPAERKFIALLTILILVWFFSLEVWAVSNHVLRFTKILPSMILQIMWIALFSYSYLCSLKFCTEGFLRNLRIPLSVLLTQGFFHIFLNQGHLLI